ncbi:tetratricopeptide repeat protein [Streptomyces sp. NBC_00019]|uniref:tetratricopeptide repeat protein n=1 Tax=Streptomyces sp. NBC_00019 TaxID=2975623 RepID=UPI00324A78D5
MRSMRSPGTVWPGSRVGGTLQLHRLTQEMLAGQMTSQEPDRARADAEALLAAANPGNSSEPRFWPAWQVLLPHALAIDPARLTTSRGRYVVGDACWYLMDRGQARPARERLQRLYDTCLQQLGPDHDDTLRAAHNLARAYNDTQDHERALALDEDTLARRRASTVTTTPAPCPAPSTLLAGCGRWGGTGKLSPWTRRRWRRAVG